MIKIRYTFSLLVFYCISVFSQQTQIPIKIEGEAQGTTYHITYFDHQNRDFQPEIEQILKDFDLSVSTYIPNSIISKINSNVKNVIVDKYFIACFNKAKEVWKNTNGAFDPTVYPLSNAGVLDPARNKKSKKPRLIASYNLLVLN